MNGNFRAHCTRTVPFDICERTNPADQLWWKNVCEKLEADYILPEDQREDVIWELFPHSLAENILRILNFDCVNQRGLTPSNSEVDLLRSKIDRIKSGKSDHRKSSSNESPVAVEEQDSRSRRVAGPNNPYKNFFRKPKVETAIWKEMPPLKLEEMNMTQKSEAITEMIATDFVEWLKNIGGENKSSLDVPTLKKMFEIGFQTHAATSLCVRVKEMPAVPAAVAKAHNEPEQSIAAKLHHQLTRDVERTKGETKMFAFGTMLPQEIRKKPPKDNITDKWVHGNKIPKELESMAGVWEGIINLRSTKGFCAWIMTHPDVPQPQYLKDAGMLTSDFRKYSVDSKESYDPNFGKQIQDD